MAPTRTCRFLSTRVSKLKSICIIIKSKKHNFIFPTVDESDIIFFNQKEITIKAKENYLYDMQCEILCPQDVKHTIKLMYNLQIRFLKVINNEIFFNLGTVLISNQSDKDCKILKGDKIFKINYFKVVQPKLILNIQHT